MTQPVISLYACGGAALNIVKPLVNATKPGNNPGYAKLNFALLDTSKSNLKGMDNIDDIFYPVEGRGDTLTDGSGKVRTTNLPAVRQSVPEILQRFQPGDLSIVISSGSGGSGSVLAPVLVSELLARNKNVIVIMVGSTTCAKEVTNTIESIESYQSIAKVRNKPVVCFYVQNGKAPMSHNDSLALTVILMLTAIWSGENMGLDRKDLENFINYQNVTGYPIGVVGLDFQSGHNNLIVNKGQPISTIITMVSSKDEDHTPGIPVGYHSFGEFSPEAVERVGLQTPVHLSTIQGYFAPILAELRVLKAESEEHYRINPVDSFEVEGVAGSDGLVA